MYGRKSSTRIARTGSEITVNHARESLCQNQTEKAVAVRLVGVQVFCGVAHRVSLLENHDSKGA